MVSPSPHSSSQPTRILLICERSLIGFYPACAACLSKWCYYCYQYPRHQRQRSGREFGWRVWCSEATGKGSIHFRRGGALEHLPRRTHVTICSQGGSPLQMGEDQDSLFRNQFTILNNFILARTRYLITLLLSYRCCFVHSLVC
jgi:hypothetical protein